MGRGSPGVLPTGGGISMLAVVNTSTNIYTIEAGPTRLHAEATEDGILLESASTPAPLADGRRLRSFVGTLPDGSTLPLYVEESSGDHEYVVYLRGEAVRVHLVTPRDEHLHSLRKSTRAAGLGEIIIRAPMPGLVGAILVQPGDIVEKGDTLLFLEAMKMENAIKSPGRLRVLRIFVKTGQPVKKGEPLVELGPIEETSGAVSP